MLSRLQFAANISFHILFPTITIAMGWFLLYFRIRHIKTRDPAWEEAYYFWTKVFALSFALGVVSGIVMSFQFGTNWPGFMERTGNISGPLLGYEVLTAFFLEASFLGIMLFGRNRVSPRMHLVATALVTLGTTLSAFWILSLNSWMQTPAGFEIVNGKFIPVDWFAVVFNPSFPYRLAHKLLASALTASFLIAGLCAWQLIKGSATGGTHKALRTAIIAASVAMPLQFLAGDMHGLNTLQHQPAKIAAIEGRIIAQLTPETMMESMRWMVLGLSAPERLGLLQGMRAAAPPRGDPRPARGIVAPRSARAPARCARGWRAPKARSPHGPSPLLRRARARRGTCCAAR